MESEFNFLPLFGSAKQIQQGICVAESNVFVTNMNKKIDDATYSYELGVEFLAEVSGNAARFNTSRTWVNIYYNYCWLVAKKPISEMGRIDFRRFMDFTFTPPQHLISNAPYSMFIKSKLSNQGEMDSINPKWKPFVNRTSYESYKRTDGSVKAQLSILSSLYGFLYDEGYVETNPAKMYLSRVNLKSIDKITVKDEDKERALSETQWKTVWQIVCELAEEQPETHGRTRFLFAMFVYLYLRVSELSARPGYEPTMNLFEFKNGGHWSFYVPRSKHGKSRHVMCPDGLIEELKMYRTSLGLPPLPEPDENYPLFPRWIAASHGRKKGLLLATLGKESIQDTVKTIFRMAYERLLEDSPYEANDMLTYSSHSLRHTGIGIDLKNKRKPEDIMIDAGHSDLSTLSKYSKHNVSERYASAKHKKI